MPADDLCREGGEKGENAFGGEMCGTVTRPSADCESSTFNLPLIRCKRGRLLAPHLAACNIVGRKPGAELSLPIRGVSL
jgi:hypothetical protein